MGRSYIAYRFFKIFFPPFCYSIRSNSLEFLRPVFTFVLCNPTGIPESKSIWNLFLANAGKSVKSIDLFYDTLCWIRVSRKRENFQCELDRNPLN